MKQGSRKDPCFLFDDPNIFAQAIVDGVVVGSMIGLAALGLTLVWAVERFANLSQGDTLTLAAYLALGLNVGAGLPMIAAAILAIAGTVVIVQLSYIVAFRPLRSAPRVALLMASIGVGLVYRGVLSLVFGTRLQGSHSTSARDFFGLFHVSVIDVVILATVAGLCLAIYLVLFRTRLGMEVRAVADLPDLARVSGINSGRILRITWAVSALVTAVGGILLGAKISLTPVLGWNVLLESFAATVLGTIGNPVGALIGGLVLGMATEVSTVFLNPTFKEAVAFGVLAIILLSDPRDCSKRR